MKIFKITFIFVSYLLAINVFAVEPLPGMIPKGGNGDYAIDLTLKGNDDVLSVEEVTQMANTGVDIAGLTPSYSQIYDGVKKNAQLEKDSILDLNISSLEYIDKIATASGNYRMSIVDKLDPNRRTYTLMMGKKLHNILLRKNILRKLGYIIPGIQYLPKVVIHYRNKIEMELMLNDLKEGTFGAVNRWVVSQEDKSITFQDAILMNSNEPIYNLAMGIMTENIVQDRRVLSSLLVPYALTNVPESVNLYSWIPGTVLSENIRMDYPEANVYGTKWEDARWIANKILKLRKKDLYEIVRDAYLPGPVSQLLFEKLKSRRNELINLFKTEDDKVIKTKHEFSFDPKKSNGKYLHLGELTLEKWPGYASRFSYGDPESPLNSKEIWGYTKSRALSLVIDNAVNILNSQNFMGTNLNDKLLEKQYEIYIQQLFEYLITGKVNPTPFSVFTIPTFSGNLILSRNIVAGSYLGTDNRIQLVDTFGVAASAGAYLGTTGIPVPYRLSGGVRANYYRTYSHVRPITSIKKALKYPYKNIMVPLVKLQTSKILKDIKEFDPEKMSKEDKASLKNIMKVFNDKLNLGESIIITDNIAGSFNVDAGLQLMSFGQNIKGLNLYAQFAASATAVARTHILKASDNTIHIYRDLGNVNSIGASIILEATVPVLKLSFKGNKGRARVKFYNLKTNSKYDSEKETIKKGLALRSLFMKNSVKRIKEIAPPYTIRHKFGEKAMNLGLMVFKMNKANTSTHIEVEHPRGKKLNAYKRVKYLTTGMDYEGLVTDLGNTALGLINNVDLVIPSTGSNGNPGNTFFGSARNKVTSFEGIFDKYNRISTPYMKLSYIWNGWRMKKKKLLRIVDRINKKYDFVFLPKILFNETKSVILYNLRLDINLHKEGIFEIMKSNYSRVKEIFAKHGNKEKKGEKWAHRMAMRFMSLTYEFKTNLNQKNVKTYSQKAIKVFELLEKKLTLQGLTKIAGGKKNIFISSRLDGFRNGDENGDRAVISNTIGEFGRRSPRGILAPIAQSIGMTEGEFFLNWLISRPI